MSNKFKRKIIENNKKKSQSTAIQSQNPLHFHSSFDIFFNSIPFKIITSNSIQIKMCDF